MLLLLLLPSLALASIKVSMNGAVYYGDNKFNIIGVGNQKGFDQQIITTDDLATLDIGIEQLKSMIEKVNEVKPDEVLVNSDYDWGNAYTYRHWKYVQRKVKPEVDDYYLDFKQEKVVLSNTNYDNPEDTAKTVQITESQIVNNNVVSIWTRPLVKTVNVKVKFSFRVEDDYVASLKKDFTMGEDRRFVYHEHIVQNHTIDLLPKQSVKARLEATKGTITAVIPYKVTVSGDAVAKYNSMYKNKFLYKFDINQLLEENHRNSTITVYQTVLFEFHYNVKLHIIGTDEKVLRTFSEELKSDTRSRKRTTKKEFESADGVKLLKKSLPAEFIERIHKEVVQETVEGNDESS